MPSANPRRLGAVARRPLLLLLLAAAAAAGPALAAGEGAEKTCDP
jgi:hypothetical protein